MTFVKQATAQFESDPDVWKDTLSGTKIDDRNKRSDKKVAPPPRVLVAEQNSTSSMSTPPRDSNSNKADYPGLYCHVKGHHLYKCNEYMALNRQRREHAFAERNLCTNCISLRHTLAVFPSLRTCRPCLGKHHGTLCSVKIRRAIHHALLLEVLHTILQALQLHPPL